MDQRSRQQAIAIRNCFWIWEESVKSSCLHRTWQMQFFSCPTWITSVWKYKIALFFYLGDDCKVKLDNFYSCIEFFFILLCLEPKVHNKQLLLMYTGEIIYSNLAKSVLMSEILIYTAVPSAWIFHVFYSAEQHFLNTCWRTYQSINIVHIPLCYLPNQSLEENCKV